MLFCDWTVSGRACTMKSSPLTAVLGPFDVHREIMPRLFGVVLLDDHRQSVPVPGSPRR